MNGPEHYREAERLLRAVGDTTAGDLDARVAAAQVHATLAMAAATIEAVAATTSIRADERASEWRAVTS